MRLPLALLFFTAFTFSISVAGAETSEQCKAALDACQSKCRADFKDQTGDRATCIAGCSTDNVACDAKRGYKAGKEAAVEGYDATKEVVGKGYDATKEVVGKGVDATKDAYEATKEYIKKQFEDGETPETKQGETPETKQGETPEAK